MSTRTTISTISRRFCTALCICTALTVFPATGHGADIYTNDFNSGAASLQDLTVGEIGTAEVVVDGGQLRINPGQGFMNRGFVSADIPNLNPDYDARLSANGRLVSWAFNVSNEDGGFNNLWELRLSSTPDPSDSTTLGYSLQGGGLVGNRILFRRIASANSPFGPVAETIIDVPDPGGLDPLPSIGAIRLTYAPATGEWRLYFDSDLTAQDPLDVATLAGTGINDGFADEALPFVTFRSQNTGSAYFDNLTVATRTLGGSVRGLEPAFILGFCINRSTGQTVVFPLINETAWDCEAAGLNAGSGDVIDMFIRGVAQ